MARGGKVAEAEREPGGIVGWKDSPRYVCAARTISGAKRSGRGRNAPRCRRKKNQAGRKRERATRRTSGRPRGKRLKKAARGAVLAAGTAAAHLMAEAGEAPMKLFSSGAVDRLVAPMTRFHD